MASRYFLADQSNGSYISGHNSLEVAERKVKTLAKSKTAPVQAIVVDEWDQEVVKEGDLFIARDVPGVWYEVRSDGALSNSAYHRLGSASWEIHFRKVASGQFGPLEDDPGEVRYQREYLRLCDAGSRRGDQPCRGLVKVPHGFSKMLYLSAGNPRSIDSVETEIDLSQLEPVRIIPESGAHP
jgi:hypothetical protein